MKTLTNSSLKTKVLFILKKSSSSELTFNFHVNVKCELKNWNTDKSDEVLHC